MFKELGEINSRPQPFQYYTADDLWTDEYTSQQMLKYHLNESLDVSSRKRDFIEKSEEWIASRFNIDDKTEVADFGCGPGLYTLKMALRGAKVSGIDFSQNSIDYAREQAKKSDLNITYIVQNYLEFETSDRFDLITMIMCDFCALSPGQRKILLSKFHSFLKPDGAVLLDVYSLSIFNERVESASYEKNQLFGFWSPDDYYAFVNTFKYEKEKVILDKYTIIEGARKRIIYNWLQYFSSESLIKEFENNGFMVEDIYSDIAGNTFDKDSPEIAIVARKI